MKKKSKPALVKQIRVIIADDDGLLLDLRMPIINGMEAIHAILEKAAEANIIVLTAPTMGTKTFTGHCRPVRRLTC